MPMLARMLVALVLLAVAGFCVFGFLATFEPPGFPSVRLVYGVVGCLCLAGAGWVVMRRGKA